MSSPRDARVRSVRSHQGRRHSADPEASGASTGHPEPPNCPNSPQVDAVNASPAGEVRNLTRSPSPNSGADLTPTRSAEDRAELHAPRTGTDKGPTATPPEGREGGRRKSSGVPRTARADTTRRVKGTRQLVSLSAAAAYADVSTRTLRRYIAQGRLTGYRIGPRLVKVDLSELDQLARPIPTARGRS